MENSPQNELAATSNAGGLVPTLARATLPPAESSEIGPLGVIHGLRTNQNLGEKVLHQIEVAIEATTAVWDAGSKSFVDRPDFKTRLAACELYLAHTVGLPVQRSENLNLNAQAKPALEEVCLNSPAALDAMRRVLDKAERAGSQASVFLKSAVAVGEAAGHNGQQ